MKAGNIMYTNDNILGFVNRLVSISDFSKGKTAKIFEDIKKNRNGYVVLKNNQPSAVLISIDEYSEIVEKAKKMELLLEKVDEYRLIKSALEVSKTYKEQEAHSFESVLAELGISEKEINDLEDSVAIE